MISLRTIIPTVLIIGLIVVEVLAGNPLTNSAQSQLQLTNNQTQLILSILQDENKAVQEINPQPSVAFLDFDLPDNPGQLISDTQNSYSTLLGSRQPGVGLTLPSGVLSDVLPPLATPLYYAYQDGYTAWYIQGVNVLAINSTETIRSFNSATGAETDWLQDKLALLPVTDPNAYQTYQTTYHAKIAAETKTWALFEFPSKGVLKVAKPAYIAAPNTGGTYSNLPDILPGYGN